MTTWVPQLLWRLSWFSPMRWLKQALATLVLPHFPNIAIPNRIEATLLLIRLLTGGLLLAWGVWALTNPAWIAHVRATTTVWGLGHPNFIMQDLLLKLITPQAALVALGWGVFHCWAGLALMSGLLFVPTILVLVGLHGFALLASLPIDGAAALFHLPILLLLPLLVLANMGHRWGLDYWITPTEQLAEIGLYHGRQTSQTRRKSSGNRVKLKPTPDLDDDSDDDADDLGIDWSLLKSNKASAAEHVIDYNDDDGDYDDWEDED